MPMFPKNISDADVSSIKELAKVCRGDILTMTTLSASGHPGGSMSSIDMLLSLYRFNGIRPENYSSFNRDHVVVSIGHISPAVYMTLSSYGFFDKSDAISTFRVAGSIYEGHIERSVHGVEWTTGNLGQGLSAACGMAIASKVRGDSNFIYCLMGDGEQQKGQISEARRFANKNKLSNLIAIIDNNGLQIGGDVNKVMPQNLAAEYAADGWSVFNVDGHDIKAFVETVHKAQNTEGPSVILAKTVMGKSVSFMENRHEYHGSTLNEEKYTLAMAELGLTPDIEKYKKLKAAFKPDLSKHTIDKYKVNMPSTSAVEYAADVKTDCRSAYGKALSDIVAASLTKGATPIAVFDCDLAGSVKTNDVEKKHPERFFQCGISEHHAAACAGAASSQGVVSVYSSFTMFAVDEVYNQLRLNDINGANIKVISTHSGIDVGEDGKTHQCVDYISLAGNLLHYKVIVPADPNQTDKVVRHAVADYGNYIISMGRSKLSVITDTNGKPFFGEKYSFEYGKIDKIRDGKYPILSYGVMLERAVKAHDILAEKGINAGVYNVSTPVHPDEKTVLELAKAGVIFVYEDQIPRGGLFGNICNIIATNGCNCKVVSFGVNDYPYSGASDTVYKLMGLSPELVADSIIKRIK